MPVAQQGIQPCRFEQIKARAQHEASTGAQRTNPVTGKNIKGLREDAIIALQQYHWPGNVRELQNVVERAVLLGKSDCIMAEDLPQTLAAEVPTVVKPVPGRTLKEALAAPERQIILDVLKSKNWNRNATADVLGINRTTLYKKMKRLGLEEERRVAESPLSGSWH